MKKYVGFYCPKCNRQLAALEKFAGSSIECPRCGKEFSMPSRMETGASRFLEKASEAETSKFSDNLTARIRMIEERERKTGGKGPQEAGSLMPPWVKKAADGFSKRGGKSANPLKDIDIVDMSGEKKHLQEPKA